MFPKFAHIIVLCLGLVVSFAAQAEDQKIKVKVRLLQASEKSSVGFSSFVSDKPVEKDLADLKEQLDVLPFEHFKVLTKEKAVLPLKKQATIKLANGHYLILKALSIDNGQVGLWLNWKDESGQCLLDTRMHFDSAEAMLAGTDHNTDDGLLLAINVKELANNNQ